MTLRIAKDLVQHYVLDVNPSQFAHVRQVLETTGREMSREQPKVGSWRLFAWLDRPAIWALRPIGVTSGLDTFLLESNGLPGVVNVAEIISYVLADRRKAAGVANSWGEFAKNFKTPGVLFSTFLWLDWNILTRPDVWGGEEVPVRSQVLEGVQRAIHSSLLRMQKRHLLKDELNLLLTGSMGDADLVLYGYVRSTADLDACLFLLTQTGCDSLATEIYGAVCGRKASARPAFRSSRTELAVDLTAYSEMLNAARIGKLAPRRALAWLDASLRGKLHPELGFLRGGGSLVELKDGLANVAGKGWIDRAVFGHEDLVLEALRPCTLAQTVSLLARLDAALCKAEGFPRRNSMRLGFGSPLGRRFKPPSRDSLFSVVSTNATLPPLTVGTALHGSEDERITPLLGLITNLRSLGWREDLRILERMAERCISLQKSLGVRRETVCMLRAALDRLALICRKILNLEDALKRNASERTLSEVECQKMEQELRLLREELITSGSSLDRVFSHHSRGVISLLLNPASEARGPEHIASEVGLSMGLAVVFGAPASRIRARLGNYDQLSKEAQVWSDELDRRLIEITRPIICASHDQDFYIRSALTLLRVPTWALWHTSAASLLLHELGHAFALAGNLSYLIIAVLRRLIGKGVPACPVFEGALTELGMPASHADLSSHTPDLQSFIAKYMAGSRLASLSVDEATNRPPTTIQVDQGLLSEFEEIAADIVSRLFCYADGPGEDGRHLWDCFDYLVPPASRWQPSLIHGRLLRLFGAHIAICQLRRIREQRLRPLSQEGRQTLRNVTQEATNVFLAHLKNWADDYLSRRENKALSISIFGFLRRLPAEFDRAMENCGENYQMAAQVLAIVLSISPLKSTRNQSLFKSTQIWGNLAGEALAKTGGEGTERKILQQIISGRVPTLKSKHPERLPRAVAWEFRGAVRHEVPAQARFALACYLRDLYPHE